VFDGFIKAAGRIGRIIETNPPSLATVTRRDARKLSGIPDESVDLIVTSPPYVNAIDYMRGHKLSLVWLGFPISRLTAMNKRYVGSGRQQVDVEQESTNNPSYRQLSSGLRQMLVRYIDDMTVTTLEMARVLKPRGQAVLVVGNSTLSGIRIDTANLVRNCAEGSGLQLVMADYHGVCALKW
jgi:DNA modification methylase